jgi:hypothetical protein
VCAAYCCRIQFEVSVRVLGGLMSLGYQIGTIMRRTSTIVSSCDGVTSVKFDDVENLGKYVQVSCCWICTQQFELQAVSTKVDSPSIYKARLRVRTNGA